MSQLLMRVRRVIDVEVKDLPRQLTVAREESRKSLAQICRDAGITPTYWYALASGKYKSGHLKKPSA